MADQSNKEMTTYSDKDIFRDKAINFVIHMIMYAPIHSRNYSHLYCKAIQEKNCKMSLQN